MIICARCHCILLQESIPVLVKVRYEKLDEDCYLFGLCENCSEYMNKAIITGLTAFKQTLIW